MESKMEVENASTKGPNWLDLPRDLTANILQRIGTIEILVSTCRVCPLWWNICKGSLMWRTIKMTNLCYTSHDDADLLKVCFNLVKRSCGHLEDIDIDRFCSNDLLKCIVNNGSHLHSMRLVDCWKFSDIGFCEAVRNLPRLVKVDISLSKISEDSIQVLGRCCPLLKSFKYYIRKGLEHCESNAIAFVIAETMPGLCHLDIKGHGLSDVGLLAILDKCPLLKSLDIRGCHYLKLSESLEKRCIDQFNELNLPDDDYFDPNWDWDYPTSDDDPYWYYSSLNFD